MTTALHAQIQERLLSEQGLDDATVNIIDAAYAGDAALESLLARLSSAEPPPPRTALRVAKVEPPGVYLSSLRVAGFRGVGAERTLNVPPGPGLTVLVGRNGSGKSSFAEGIETLMTGDSRRWAGRAKEWKGGWRNLHTSGGSFIEATFTVEGDKPVVLRRQWQQDAPLEQSELRVRRGNETLDGLAQLGWSEALGNFRPFLCYSELGELLNKPSELYDSLRKILGLEESDHAIKRVQLARKPRDERQKKAKDEHKQWQRRLEELPDDPRAQRCRAALKGRTWQLDELEKAVLGEQDGDAADGVRLLASLAQLSLPTVDAVAAASDVLRNALGKAASLAGTSAEHHRRLAQLLEQALACCPASEKACPVCGGALPATWAEDARRRLEESRALAAKVHDADDACKQAERRLRALIAPVPPELKRAAEAGLPTQLLDAWRAFAQAPADPAALCEHAEAKLLELHGHHAPFVEQAQHKLDQLQSAWRPIASGLAAWLIIARAAEAESSTLDALKSAEKWLKDVDDDLRDARFEPIAARSQEIWSILRQQSSVDLAKIKLEGKANKRHVALNVTIDGREGVAVSVMSQGELNALALSLFLPRMMLAESPFRFLIVDDPVQAMDAHKVDGLARVLEDAAKTRQVIVLSHDARLLEAIRRLQINATVLEVSRRSDSVVELDPVLDPVERYFKDALSIAHSERQIGARMAARIVPGFCRLAIEAACIEAIRRRRYSRGDPHEAVEREIADAEVHPLVALALFDDQNRGSDVYQRLNKCVKDGATILKTLKTGAHSGFDGNTEDLIRDSRALAKQLRAAV